MSNYLTHKPGSLEEVVAKATQQESGYQDKFKKELEKTGRGIGSMTPKEKSAFFNKIDKMHKAKNEEVINEIGSFSKIYTKKAMGSHPSKKAENVFYKGLVQSINVGLRGKPPKRDTEIGIIGRDGSRYYAEGIGQAGLKDLGVHSNRQDALKAVFDYSVKSKQIKEEDAYDNDRFIIKNGKATVDNSNTADNKDHVHAPNAKIALQLHKQGKKVYKEGLETVVPPKNKEEDEKDLKRKTTMTGSKPTEIDTKPQIKY